MVEQPVQVETVSGGAPPRRHLAFRVIGAAILAGHGVVHLMGFALLWRLGQFGGLHYADIQPAPGSVAGLVAGVVWLAAMALFVLAAVLLVVGQPQWRLRWRPAAVLAAVVSVAVLVPSASVVAVGLIIDVVVLVAIAATTPSFRRPRR